MKHPLIIGAGGVASYMLPVLLKTFKPEALTIVDKDTLEERNLDRQMFKPEQVGMNKAQALLMLHYGHAVGVINYKTGPQWPKGITVIEQWFTESTMLPEGIDAIFCVADNHMARYAAICKANELGCYAYIGGNEYVDSQALVHHRDWRGTPRDLLTKYPNIATDETGSPFRCTGEAQEASPQLAMANMHCAAKLLHLAWVYERWLRDLEMMPSKKAELADTLPIEFYSSLFNNESVSAHV